MRLRYIEEFRNPQLAQAIVKRIRKRNVGKVNIMEVCGTHTVAIFRHGIRHLLPSNINLLSGPGCPVCVTPNLEIDKAIAFSQRSDVILATYGDMFKVPGSYASLEQTKAEGGDVRIVYSSLDALKIAVNNPQRKVIFFAVGFETTAPGVACSVLEAERAEVKNFFLLVAHKLIPPAMEALIESGEVNIDGFICPGHVSTIIGSRPYEFIPQRYNIPCVITGFEPLDILQSIDLILEQLEKGDAKVEIQYRRSVRPEGNPLARDYMYRVFEVRDAVWRGLGAIPRSGLRLRPEYRRFDAEEAFEVVVPPPKEHKGCKCGEILRGVMNPPQCPLFAKVCTPEHPIGPCMVSSEGSCAAWYHYGAPAFTSDIHT